jgi:hypothetical protein
MHPFSKVLITIAAFLFLHSLNAQLIHEDQKIQPNDYSSRDRFGYAVSMSGDYAVIGSYHDDDLGEDSGSAWVYHYNGTFWEPESKLTASDGTYSDHFGYSVCISGNTILIGAPGKIVNGIYMGTAYLFSKASGLWQEIAKLYPTDGTHEDEFGYSVAICGNFAAVGSPFTDHNGNNAGSVYIYQKQDTKWLYDTTVENPENTGSSYFSYSLSIFDNLLMVGIMSGNAYVYELTEKSNPVVIQKAKLLTDFLNIRYLIINSVDICNDYAAISATIYKDENYSNGFVYVYEKPEKGWEDMSSTIVLGFDLPDEHFYWYNSVSVTDSLLAAGSIASNDSNGSLSGTAYVFKRPRIGWIDMSPSIQLSASDGKGFDLFGASLSLEGNRLLVGAPVEQYETLYNGSAYFFQIPPLPEPEFTDDFRVGPNPTKGIIFIETTGNYQITLSDMTGRICEQTKIDYEKIIIDLSEHPRGMYFMNFKNDSTNRTLKLILQ